MAHLRANLILLLGTLVLCCVLYPLALLVVGKVCFPANAAGSLMDGPDGIPVGSRLIAQEFKSDEWFQPRPSAAGYKADASQGSNWAASNPRLRDRIARQLATTVSYRRGTRSRTVQEDVEAWFAAKPDRLAAWVKASKVVAEGWVAGNTTAVDAWKADNAGDFWETFGAKHPRAVPTVENDTIVPAIGGPAVQTWYFDSWLKENPERLKDIEPVPADAVLASGSGLDPHITLTNARSQAERVINAWAAKSNRQAGEVRTVVEAVLKDSAFTPLFGLADGEALVNVLEANVELAKRLKR
jgi:K+-transporting ATPase ATPase C chain